HESAPSSPSSATGHSSPHSRHLAQPKSGRSQKISTCSLPQQHGSAIRLASGRWGEGDADSFSRRKHPLSPAVLVRAVGGLVRPLLKQIGQLLLHPPLPLHRGVTFGGELYRRLSQMLAVTCVAGSN